MLPRLLSGILAVVFLPLGVAFTVVGAATMRMFLYIGLPFLVVGLILGVVFLVLQRREAARRRRRRAGPRTMAEVISAEWNPGVRIGTWLTVKLTVRYVPAGTVARTVLIPPTMRLTQGGSIEVFYDPQEPSNFEPVASVQRTLLAA
jgi:hypothetical protein